MNLAKIKSDLQHFAYDCLPMVSRAWGKVLLSRQSTIRRLRPYAVFQDRAQPVFLPHADSLNGVPFFRGGSPKIGCQTIHFDPDFVWAVTQDERTHSIRILPSGNPVLNNRSHLNLDFSPLKGLLESHRIRTEADTVIASWPHGWGGYYDFVIFVLAKWVRMEHALGPELWQQATVAHARYHQPFEDEFARLMGIPAERLADSRQFAGAMGVKRLIAANNHSLFYPSPLDLERIRARFTPATGEPGKRKLFVSRAHTRRILNEQALKPILDRHGFEFIEDKPRSVQEQIELFGQAAAIVGPHGAAMTNMIWAPAGARVLEFFHKNYFPPYFYYLATALGHTHQCWIAPPAQGDTHHNMFRYADMTVDEGEFEGALERLSLGEETKTTNAELQSNDHV